MSLYLKDPGAALTYTIDWGAAYLGELAIAASSWTVSPDEDDGVVIEGASSDFTRAGVRVSGGVAGHVYRLTNRVELTDGSVDERSLSLRLEDR